ncbi:TetR/AcrR family transcriptional regulator [Microbacterium hatanonis]|uniref:TetR/AcrR family transcriptional regulator n=1 Tax=Microbacterium hatanonis TaxID=404366 RepID=A0A5C8I203_9MICO|nr:TetR/AcrR family transcriptional regulator [Microbacterium hatanonis]TXK11955.1 TetR/AcrR family transcriptional regulator [Microbacterium hatanonis]
MPLPRSGPVRSEAARLSILEATAALIAERGYDHLTMEGIAARAGVGKQTIYRWWPSKGAVTAECLFEGMLVPGRFQLPHTGDVRRDLASWLGEIFGYLGSEQGESILRSLIGAAAENADVGRRLRDALFRADSLSARLTAAIGTTSNLPPDAPVEELAEALIGAVLLRALSREPVAPGDAERLLDAVLGR